MALDKTIITKRLTYIKYLYQQGVEQSKLPEVIAGFPDFVTQKTRIL